MNYAFRSMFFAGFTSVIAKRGLAGITGELGLTVRTLCVTISVLCFASATLQPGELTQLRRSNIFWLGLSGVTTAVSWIYYYKALKFGDVSTIALIDKGSVVVSILLAWLFLREAMTLRLVTGSGLIVLGLLVIAKKI
jgi:transporter family protein